MFVFLYHLNGYYLEIICNSTCRAQRGGDARMEIRQLLRLVGVRVRRL